MANTPGYSKLIMNYVSKELRMRFLKAHCDELRETNDIIYPPTLLLKSKIRGARGIDQDAGYRYGSYNLWYCDSPKEVLRLFMWNLSDLFRAWDEEDKTIAFGPDELSQLDKFIMESQFLIEYFLGIFANWYAAQHADSLYKCIKRQTNNLLRMESDFQECQAECKDQTEAAAMAFTMPTFHKLKLKRISSMMFIEDMLIGLDEHAKSHAKIPLLKIFFLTRQALFDSNNNVEFIGLRKNSMKILFNKWKLIDKKVTEEKLKHKGFPLDPNEIVKFKLMQNTWFMRRQTSTAQAKKSHAEYVVCYKRVKRVISGSRV